MRIALVTNQVRGGWSPLDSDGWGGGEEVATHLARAFAARGHDIVVYYDGPPLADGGVRYDSRERATPGFDLALHLKSPEDAKLNLGPKRVLFTDQDRPFDPEPFDLIAPCSQALSRYFATLLPRSVEKLHVIPYGYDPGMFQGDAPVRNPKQVLHASSPDRGLEDLLTLWPRVLEQRPETHLCIAYGWDLFDKYGGDKALKLRIGRLLEQLPPGSWSMQRYPASEMGRLYRESGVWGYYCTGGEQFCLTAVKAQVAGCVPVVRPWRVLTETVWSGLKAETPDAFVAAMVDALDPTRQEALRDQIDTGRAHSWDDVARRWEEVLDLPPAKPAETHLVQIPGTPEILPAPEKHAPMAVGQLAAGWLGSLGEIRAPWLDPSLGLALNRDGQPLVSVASPKDADAVVVGWQIEDAETSPAETLARLGIPHGAPVMVVASYGAWRAKQRRRLLLRKDLNELFAQQPDCVTKCQAIDEHANGVSATVFRYVPSRLGTRDLARVRATTKAPESLSVCMIVRNAERHLMGALRSVQDVADEVCIVDTGSEDATEYVVDRFRRTSGIPVKYLEAARAQTSTTTTSALVTTETTGTTTTRSTVPVMQAFGNGGGLSPRWCFDCLKEHAVGEMAYGCRVAGFETPRNQSVALASGQWVLWLDSDEVLENGTNLRKYLRPNAFDGFAIPQHHFTVEPPGAPKIDYPVRLFRATKIGEPGWVKFGPLDWPTYDTGLTVRFAGIVHEHPGSMPTYVDGVNPVLILSDIAIGHSGYHTEQTRRGRFVRNWPLMVLDLQKYPDRRLGQFLKIRDLILHVGYFLGKTGNMVTPEIVQCSEEALRLWEQHFLTAADPFANDALDFATTAQRVLRRGLEAEVSIRLRRPEVSGDEAVMVQFAGRVPDEKALVKMLEGRLGECERWQGSYC